MKTADFDYNLPEYLIAERPLEDRSGSRLLVLHKDGRVSHKQFCDLPGYLDRRDLLLMNNTKVFPARLTGLKENGGRLDVLLVRRRDEGEWEVLTRGRYSGSLRIGDDLEAEVRKGSSLKFRYSGDIMDMIWRYGNMPIPPYIKRAPDEEDRRRYQTVYAKNEGSVAAPTAGLHFTEALLKEIAARGVRIREITLHVGIGTFKPIRADDLDDHSMDAERFEIATELLSEIEETRRLGGRLVTVGTTTTRAIEGYMSGRRLLAARNGILRGTTDIFIFPGYSFKAVDALITNFHLPGSTPLMLASAMAGREKLFSAYREAIAREYRFLSYGDAMLIL